MKKITLSIVKHPLLILVLILVVTATFFVVLKQNSTMETDLDKYMPQSHPAFVYSDQAEEWFNIKDGIIIAVENKAGIYNSGTLEKVKSLTKNLQKMEEIEKADVTSLYTADNIIGSDMGLEVNPFYTKVPQSESSLSELKNNVKNNDMVYKRLVSEDEEVTIIIAEINDDVFSQGFYQKILDLSSEYEGPEKIYVAGRPIVEGTMALMAPADMKKMVPIVIFIIIIVLLLVIKSFKATILTLLVVLFSVVWSFGLMASLSIPIYAVSTMIPVMLIAIGVADGIHLFSHLRLFLTENPDAKKNDAVRNMIQEMWKPVVMTSVTTAIGFISLLTSSVYPIKYFGLFTAFGVLMAMIFSLVLIPAGIMLFGLPRWKSLHKTKIKDVSKFSQKFTTVLLKYKQVSIILTAIILAVALWGMSRVWIDSSFISQFDETTDIVRTDTFINSKFGGTSTLNLILDAENPDSFKNPEILNILDRLQSDVEETLEMVGNSFSLTDYLKRMNQVMHEDDTNYNIIPETGDLVAQYLLLYEMSGDPDKLWEVVDYNFQKANMTFQLKSDNSQTLKSTIEVIEKYKNELNKDGVTINYAGSGYKALVFSDLILQGQISSIILSLILVILLLSLMFRSLVIGLIGSVPIIITAAISFGVMGLLNIPLSTTTALLSSIAIGIGVDYAVHFIERYRIYAFETKDKIKTLDLTMKHSGQAIFYNAIVVIAGFLVLLSSLFPLNRALGALVSLNMFTSFAGTLTIMAILLVQSNKYFSRKKGEKNDK